MVVINLEPRRPGLGPVDRPAKVSTNNRTEEQNDLEEEPRPATAALLLRGTGAAAALTAAIVRGTTATAVAAERVQVLGLDGDDVVVIAQLASLGGETEVRNGGNGKVGVVGGKAEALGP